MPKYAYLIPFLNLIPFFAGFNILFNFKNVKAKLFSAYLIVTAICGLICFYIAMIDGNNHWCYNSLQIIVLILLALLVQKYKYWRKSTNTDANTDAAQAFRGAVAVSA